MELASKTALGGIAGTSTFKGELLHHVYSDGVYAWREKPAGSIAGTAADLASRPALDDVQEGFEVFVETNKLTYVKRDGIYTPKAIQVTVADDAARDLLTEMEDKQRAFIASQDSIDTYVDGAWVQGVATIPFNTFADITSPADYTVGDQLIVTNDPDESLNGTHNVLGGNIGTPGVSLELDS